jgi:hypothetical protein
LAKILPLRRVEEGLRKTSKVKCIEASIRELGLIEPLVVFPQANSDGCHILLDGHVRHMILKSLGESTAKCLIAIDDEGFTYNHKINRLSAIQEHFMILRAIENGVVGSPHRPIARRECPYDSSEMGHARGNLHRSRENPQGSPGDEQNLSTAAAAEADSPDRSGGTHLCRGELFRGLREVLVAATPPDQLVEEERPKEVRGLSSDDVARMEHEMATLAREFKLIEDSHGKNVLNLVIVNGCLKKLLDNARVVRFLSQYYPEILAEFQKLIDARNLQHSRGNGSADIMILSSILQ